MDKEKKLIPNSTQIPNVLLDFVIPQISEAEGKCLLYICRRTYGFHKERDRISFNQFIKGIKNKDGEQLDYGSGLARASVSEALKNLVGSGLVKTIPTSKGNYYEINLELPVDKSINEVVQKVNWFRKQTKTGKASRPKQVHLPNLQKKGNKGNKEYGVFNKLNERRVIPIGDPPIKQTPEDKQRLVKLAEMKKSLIKSGIIK